VDTPNDIPHRGDESGGKRLEARGGAHKPPKGGVADSSSAEATIISAAFDGKRFV
jgi:hypothetical protein